MFVLVYSVDKCLCVECIMECRLHLMAPIFNGYYLVLGGSVSRCVCFSRLICVKIRGL